jgi:hypothetical protein
MLPVSRTAQRLKRAFKVADASGGEFRGVAKQLRQRRARGCM